MGLVKTVVQGPEFLLAKAPARDLILSFFDPFFWGGGRDVSRGRTVKAAWQELSDTLAFFDGLLRAFGVKFVLFSIWFLRFQLFFDGVDVVSSISAIIRLTESSPQVNNRVNS